MASLGERMAAVALATFETLPLKSKPRTHSDERREWIPMSAVLLVNGANSELETVSCVSLATGAKCLSISQIPKCQGAILHDSHAEILALRAFNRFLLGEVQSLIEDVGFTSEFIQKSFLEPSVAQPFELRPDVTIHLFSTEAPCGDASMDLLMGAKLRISAAEATPWPEPVFSSDTARLHGRGYFSALGVVRRKPSRADAESTLSKSCTDKLCLKQVTSALSFPTNLFIVPTNGAFLSTFVIPADKHNKVGFHRAFGYGGRLSKASEQSQESSTWPIHYFETEVLPSTFPKFKYSKPISVEGAHAVAKTGNVSAIWIRGRSNGVPINETLVNGVKQGFKQCDDNPKKRSLVCRSSMWEYGAEISKALTDSEHPTNSDASLSSRSYGMAKAKGITRQRAAAKDWVTSILGDWIKNLGDDDWGITEA